MVPVNGKQFIFGYNVHLGLKSEIDLSDIFPVYAYEEHSFRKLDWTVLNSGQFDTDLKSGNFASKCFLMKVPALTA